MTSLTPTLFRLRPRFWGFASTSHFSSNLFKQFFQAIFQAIFSSLCKQYTYTTHIAHTAHCGRTSLNRTQTNHRVRLAHYILCVHLSHASWPRAPSNAADTSHCSLYGNPAAAFPTRSILDAYLSRYMVWNAWRRDFHARGWIGMFIYYSIQISALQCK